MGQNRSLYIEPELGLLILVITNVTSRALVKLTLGPLVFNALFFTALSQFLTCAIDHKVLSYGFLKAFSPKCHVFNCPGP